MVFLPVLLYVIFYIVLALHLLYEMPTTRKYFFSPKEELCSLLSFYAFTLCPHSAPLTQGSNLVLI